MLSALSRSARPAVVARPAAKASRRALPARAGTKVDDVATANALDFDELTDVIRMVNETDIVEFELKSKRFSLAVRKKEALEAAAAAAAPAPQVVYASAPPAAAAAPAAAPAAAAPAPAAAAPAAAAPAAAAAAAPPAAVDGVEQASPMAGTFYRSPAPGEPAFSNPGDKVVKGQTICIIEAMKLMNEIEAETSGTLVSFTVENASPVTPGQTLAIIKP